MHKSNISFPKISPPNSEIAESARIYQLKLTKPKGSLGKIEDLSIWITSCQGVFPPNQLVKPRVVIFAGDHGVADAGVSAFPTSITNEMVANFIAGGAAINTLTSMLGATIRVVDISVNCNESLSQKIGSCKVRCNSGNIAIENALSMEEMLHSISIGRHIANEEIDSGTDILIAGDMGIGNTTPSSTLIASLTNSEPVDVVGFGTGIDNFAWMRKVSAIRDALYLAKKFSSNPLNLLMMCGAPDIAAVVGFLIQAAVRRIPVLLDGLMIASAALVARKLAPGSQLWWRAGHKSAELAHNLALSHMNLIPIVNLNMKLGEGTGAILALPILKVAISIMSSMSTFE